MDIFSDFPTIVLIVTLITNATLAGFVYHNNPKSATNIIFSSLCWVTNVWLGINYVYGLPMFFSYTLLLSRLSIFFAVPQVFLFFLLARTVPRDILGLKKKTFFRFLVLSVAIMTLTISPFAFTSIEFINGTPNPTPGWGLAPFAFFSISLSIFATYSLIKRLRLSTGVEKQQLLFIAYGMLLMLSLIIFTVLLPVALLKNTFFVPFTPLYTLLFLIMTTYAIIKHRLMDLRLVVARTVSFALLIGLFSIFYAFFFGTLESFFLSATIDPVTIGISTSLALFMVFSFQYVKRFLEQLTDKVFYKGHYDFNKLLYNLTLVMASTLKLEDLVHQLLHELLVEMRISRGTFILLERDQVYQVIHEGYTSNPEFDEKELILLLSRPIKMLIFEELPEGELKDIMRNLKFSIVCYLRVKSGHIGIIGLGEKLSGDTYSGKDVKLLEILAPEAAVAIQNAAAYEEISRFNITLKDKIDLATKDLQDANERLKALDKLKDEFISIASHELRTPMTAIKNYLWMIVHKGKSLSEEKKIHYQEGALKSTVRLINLVNDMLNVSRIESGRITLSPVRLSISELVNEVTEELKIKFQEKNINFILEKKNVPEAFADKDKIREVIINLIGNAIKFTPKNGTILVDLREEGEMIETSISDTGIGIKPEDLTRLFQKFGRLDNRLVSVAETEGTGLGLYICKQFVELSGGVINVQSEVGKGTTFTFSLPKFKENQTTVTVGTTSAVSPSTVST